MIILIVIAILIAYCIIGYLTVMLDTYVSKEVPQQDVFWVNFLVWPFILMIVGALLLDDKTRKIVKYFRNISNNFLQRIANR